MTIAINAQGAERKRLVQTISLWLGHPAKYSGAPTFNYEVDYITIDKNGSLSYDDSADNEVIERLLHHLYDEGFDIDQSESEDEEISGVCISMLAVFSPTATLKTSRPSSQPRATSSRRPSALTN